MEQEFNFESIKNKALEQLKSGKSLLGKDGAFAPLLESILNAALEGEMEAHLSDEERETGNRRNGKMQKQVQTPLGEVTVSTPRDRNSTFDPQFIKKRGSELLAGSSHGFAKPWCARYTNRLRGRYKGLSRGDRECLSRRYSPVMLRASNTQFYQARG